MQICVSWLSLWLLLKPGPRPWARTLKNLDPEKHGINMGLKNMSHFRELSFVKTMHNVICTNRFVTGRYLN